MTRRQEIVENIADALRDHDEFSEYARSLDWDQAKRVASDVVDHLIRGGLLAGVDLGGPGVMS